MGSKFRELHVFWTILQKLVPAKIIAKLLIHEIREISFLVYNVNYNAHTAQDTTLTKMYGIQLLVMNH